MAKHAPYALYPFRDDHISTSEIGRRIGIPISAAFIIHALGVNPTISAGHTFYWSPMDVLRVYGALVDHINSLAYDGTDQEAQ